MTEHPDTISFEGIEPALLIFALYHSTKPLGFGQRLDRPDLKLEEVRETLAKRGSDRLLCFDYFHGRPLKVDLDLDKQTFRTRLYDRDAGEGAAARVVDSLRKL